MSQPSSESPLHGLPPCPDCGTKHFGECSIKSLQVIIHRIDQDIYATRLHLGFLEERKRALAHKIWLLVEDNASAQATPAKPRRCSICKKPTTDKFGDVPTCRKHVGGKDKIIVGSKIIDVTDEQKKATADILEKFLYGD